MKKFLYSTIITLLFVSSSVLAQTGVVRGVVTDKSGPLPGATIMEVGMPSNGTATDIDGNFRLQLKGTSNKILVKSIGYREKTVNVNDQTVMSINLEEDAQGLEEVVVIGYGEQKKVTMTGAVSVVSGVEIRENPSASMQNALVGKMPGFFTQQQSGRPGADAADMFIRGVSSYNGNNQPLILVDDIEFSLDQFQRLDPNEVESVSILKDASTTAVYGVKGANGVILVTTRRGATGKPRINVRTEYSLQQPAMFPEFLGAYESALLHNQARQNDATNNGGTYTPAFSDEAVEAFRTGSNPYVYPDVDWKEVLFKKWSNQSRTNLDVSGGTERVKYFVSMGYLDQGGMLKNFGEGAGVNNSYYHRRVNYRSNLDVQVNKDLNLRVDLYGNIGEVNNPEMPGSQWGYNDPFYEYSSYLSLSPYAHPAYNPDGSIGYLLGLHPNRYQGPNSIIARLTYGGYTRNHENNMNLVTSATQKLGFITQGLSLKGLLSYASEYGYSRSMTRSTFPSYIWDPVTDTYSSYPNNTYRVQRFFDGYNARGTTRVLNYQAILNYDRTFGNHHVYGLALMNHRTDVRGSGGDQRRSAELLYRPISFRGYTGRIGYDFKDKYLFQFNAGYNGSPFFSSDNRFGFFPAVSAGWNISEEPFFKNNISFVDFLKVRSSYGLVGNDQLGSGFSYYYTQTFDNNGNASFGTVHNNYGGIREGRLANMDVTWEKEKKFDIGLEFKLLKSRLSATVDYFRNERYDILTQRSVSELFGVESPPANIGRVENKGYELELIWRDHIGTDFSYNLRAMYSHAQNKILFMDEPEPAEPYQRRTGNNINTLMAYQWTGEFYASEEDIVNSPEVTIGTARPGDLKYADLNNDGVISSLDMTYIGNPANIPPTTFAFEAGIAFKGFSIKSMFQGSKDFISGGAAENIQFLGSNMQEIHQKAWTPELGNNAQYPVLTENMGISTPRGATMSTFWFVPADFIRLRNAEVAYTLPQAFVQRVRMQSIRVYVNGNNLLTWSKLQERYQLDPEVRTGRDRITYPPQRIINFGLSVGF